MSDPFLDSIERTLENGDVPQRVTNRHLLAAIRGIDTKLSVHDERIGLMERWQSKATGAIKAATVLAGSGVLITILKAAGVF